MAALSALLPVCNQNSIFLSRLKPKRRRAVLWKRPERGTHAMNRILLLLVPDKRASALLLALALLSFLLGLLDILTRDLDAARSHLTLSLGIPAGLFLLKYLTLNAAYRVAEEAEHRLHQHLRGERPKGPEVSPAEVLARERAEMIELAEDLRQALSKIPEDSPVRPKYEATIRYIERALKRS